MLPCLLWLACLAVARAQDVEISQHASLEVITLTGTDRRLTGDAPTPTVHLSDFDTSTIASGSISSHSGTTGSSNATQSITSTSTSTSTPKPLTKLDGSRTLDTSDNGTASAVSGAPRATNTQPCNNYPELCNRKYSNITEVCAHNSPFSVKRNAASNQALGVTQQLNDGVRVLQGQTHIVNGTLYYCHTSCSLLNAGTVESYLTEVSAWVAAHPFDILTIIFGNGDYEMQGEDGKPLVTSSNFVDPIEKSGLKQYIYQPPKTAMALGDWPTLGEMAISGKRVVTFIDYNFDLKAAPYLLWEFNNIWETPFSPTDATFPCTLGRPSGIDKNKQKDMLYMANHNLNVEVSIVGLSLLIPNTVELNVTNGVNGSGSLGAEADQCTDLYDRPPNFLLVDYYDAGPFNGSVFEVAARANNVTYDRECCGSTSLGVDLERPSLALFALTIAIAVGMMW